MRGRAALWLIAIVTVMFASAAARADQLCGRSFGTFDQLYAELFDERTHQLRGGGPNDIMYIDGRGIFWTLTKPSHEVAPAAVCAQRITTAQRIEVQCQFWCRALRGCDTFIDHFKKMFAVRDSDLLWCEWK